MLRDFGDFQTPILLAEKVLARLSVEGRVWTRALEPTCGQGNFVRALLRMSVPPKEIIGLEIQQSHLAAARALIDLNPRTHIDLRNVDLFKTDLRKDLHWKNAEPLLVVGNPPWVTNSELGSLGSANIPEKQNIKSLNGFDAITGASNFDICEYIWIKLIRELTLEKPTIALLCKTSVARNVIGFCRDNDIPVCNAKMFRIDATDWFDASADACLFVIDVGNEATSYDVTMYNSLDDTNSSAVIGFCRHFLIADVLLYQTVEFLEGHSPYVWRQGIKHDAASVAELRSEPNGTLRNKAGLTVDIEDEFLFPLVKSSDLGGRKQGQSDRWVVVAQKRLHEDISRFASTAPKVWSYLNAHKEAFDVRKSSIYEDAPTFSYFGLGEYSFAKHKVAVSGLYKEPRFHVLKPRQNKPVMLDDTCYFLPFDSFEEADAVARVLNSDLVQNFLKAIMFPDSKRPITKKLLQRIDLHAAGSRLGIVLPVVQNGQLTFR